MTTKSENARGNGDNGTDVTRNKSNEAAFEFDASNTPARERDDIQIGDGTAVGAVRDDIVAVDEPVREGLSVAVENAKVNPTVAEYERGETDTRNA